MLLRYFYDRDLAQASYLVGCQATGQGIVIDPNRDVDSYLEAAADEGVTITAVTETHIHADFVSGARELAHRSGARLHLSEEGGPDWLYRFEHEPLRDGAAIEIGNVRLQAIHTPGHTPEHLSLLLTDGAASDEPMGVFTGDFVFVGDAGRPDLLESAAGESGASDPSARRLFNSLQKLKALPDYLQIWPGHGAGSACGKALGAVPSTTLGYEKRVNWAFAMENEEEFVAEVLSGQPSPPRYFAEMKRVNREGPAFTSDLPAPLALEPDDIEGVRREGGVIIDTRPLDEFARGHVPGAVAMPFIPGFSTAAGSVLPYDRDLYLLCEPSHEAEVLRALRRIGLDRVRGVLDVAEALAAWRERLATLPEVGVDQLSAAIGHNGAAVLDVRLPTEYDAGHIPGAPNIPMQTLANQIASIPTGRPLYVNCRSGRRSAIIASYLQSIGFEDVANVKGGMLAWKAKGLPEAHG